jgi:putative ABC transport system permease protein
VKFLLRTLSLSYVRRHRAKTFLTLLGVVVGVATYVAVVGARGSLLGGIRETVDRMAGKAQLQLTQEGGVPEELQEVIRERPGIRAQAPVIEQVVVPERGELGSLLVLGVDLLGDREMRDYGFEGEDADLDDPLLFLAQADSVAVARPLAERAGLKTGDTLVLKLPAGARSVTIRGLLTPKGFAEAFGGNLVVMDVYAAQELFGRGRRFDRLEVRLEDGVTLEAATASLRAVVPPNVKVETPERRSGQMEKLVVNFAAGFDVTSGFALGIGAFLIYNAFSVAVNRRRRDIGTLRALGATPRQVRPSSSSRRSRSASRVRSSASSPASGSRAPRRTSCGRGPSRSTASSPRPSRVSRCRSSCRGCRSASSRRSPAPSPRRAPPRPFRRRSPSRKGSTRRAAPGAGGASGRGSPCWRRPPRSACGPRSRGCR